MTPLLLGPRSLSPVASGGADFPVESASATPPIESVAITAKSVIIFFIGILRRHILSTKLPNGVFPTIANAWHGFRLNLSLSAAAIKRDEPKRYGNLNYELPDGERV
jgi:hypothetical protein